MISMSGLQLKIVTFLGSFTVSNQVFVGVLKSAIMGLFQKTHSSFSSLYIDTPDPNKYKLHQE